MPSQSEFLTPTPIITTCTLADTEYTITIPADTKQIHLRGINGARTAVASFRMAFATGKVAGSTDPFVTILAGESYSFPEKMSWDGTIYVASADAGTVIEGIAFVGR